MVSFLRSIIAPVSSLFIMIMGNGLLITLIPLRSRYEGFSTELAGYLMASYYAGLVLGALNINKLIEGVGHIRAFSAFASIFTVLTMLQGVFVNPAAWLVLRFLSGLCISGVFVTIESWLLVKSTSKTRGKALSIYMAANYASQALGQLFLDVTNPKTIIPFCLVVVLSSLAVVPLSLTRTRAPIIEEPSILKLKTLLRLSPLGVVGSFLGGMILGSIFGLLPIYAQELNYSVANIASIMGVTIFGGLCFQWPVGAISDRIDRRKVLFCASLLTLACSFSIAVVNTVNITTFLALSFIFGGLSFVLYPLAVSHASDLVDPKDLVAMTGGMLLSYGIGAIIGPILVTYPMKYVGPQGFFYFISSVCLVLALFTLSRIKTKTPVPKEDKLPHANITRTTPLASELDPRAENVEEKKESTKV